MVNGHRLAKTEDASLTLKLSSNRWGCLVI